MTEEDLLGVFHAVASRHLAPGQLSPGALLWLDHQIELAAARAADRPQVADPAAAERLAETFFSELFANARPRSIFQSVIQPAITADTLTEAYLATARWPFGTRP